MGTLDALLQDFGYVALVVILFLDSTGVPWPTEATLVAAAVAAHSTGSVTTVIFQWTSALAGSAMGSMLSYYLGRRIGPVLMQRIARFFRLSPETMAKVDQWFEKHGHRAVFFGRLVPFVRNFTGYPAGAMEVPFPKYMLFSMAGYGLYCAFALALGYGGTALAKWVGDLEILLLILIPLALLVIWFKWGRQWAKKHKEAGKG
ncbi:MAG TPA: DedA family protein [Symbiobacteriaceae bacterium]|nr:DedA family protein [Symbiobacteriaceae bacterium]